MTAGPPAQETPPPHLYTAGASFRCRRRKFRTWLTVLLAILTAATLWAMSRFGYAGDEAHFAASFNETQGEIMLTLLHWEKADPAIRWMSGYLSREAFLDDPVPRFPGPQP